MEELEEAIDTMCENLKNKNILPDSEAKEEPEEAQENESKASSFIVKKCDALHKGKLHTEVDIV